jgi:hypothetical protein
VGEGVACAGLAVAVFSTVEGSAHVWGG